MDAELLPARINDTEKLCEQTCTPKFLGFLTQAEAALARNILKNARVRTDFFGGYDGAERVMLGCFPDWAEDFPYPISPLTVFFRKADVLSHRDILGSLMALGIKRETVGDILIEEGRAVVFVCGDVKEYILNQVEKIGRVGVNMTEGCSFPLPEGYSRVRQDRLHCGSFMRAFAVENMRAYSRGAYNGQFRFRFKAHKKYSRGGCYIRQGKRKVHSRLA